MISYGDVLYCALRQLVSGLQYSTSIPMRFVSATFVTASRLMALPAQKRTEIYAPENGNS